MLQVIRAEQRYHADQGWLRTYWLFSFDEYYDPNNVHFGALRVFNDDVVAPGRGFPLHPHQEMEIVTIPLSGELTHTDSMGNRGVVHANEVQRMSAGTGVRHAEANEGDQPVHLYQIWIVPERAGLPPSYAQKGFDPSAWANCLFPVASGQGFPDAVTMHADATIYRAAFDEGKTVTYAAEDDRHLFLYITTGCLQINAAVLKTGDQARITDEGELRLHAVEATAFVLIDVPPA